MHVCLEVRAAPNLAIVMGAVGGEEEGGPVPLREALPLAQRFARGFVQKVLSFSPFIFYKDHCFITFCQCASGTVRTGASLFVRARASSLPLSFHSFLWCLMCIPTYLYNINQLLYSYNAATSKCLI